MDRDPRRRSGIRRALWESRRPYFLGSVIGKCFLGVDLL